MGIYFRAVDFSAKRSLFLGKVYTFDRWLQEHAQRNGAAYSNAEYPKLLPITVDIIEAFFEDNPDCWADKRIMGLRSWFLRAGSSGIAWLASDASLEDQGAYEAYESPEWEDLDAEDHWMGQ